MEFSTEGSSGPSNLKIGHFGIYLQVKLTTIRLLFLISLNIQNNYFNIRKFDPFYPKESKQIKKYRKKSI